MSHRYVVRNNVAKKAKPVKELTTGLSFPSAAQAGQHFNISTALVSEYANGRKKQPRLTYRFQWIMNEKD